MPEYKGKEFQLIQPIEARDNWKWIAHIDEQTTKIGQSGLKYTAVQNAKRAIEKALKDTGAK